MALLSLTGINKYFGARPVLEGVSLRLQPGEKAGLIGPNGSGKTTLLKVITGEVEPDSGAVHLVRGAQTGYLPQEPAVMPGGTLRRYLEKPLLPLLRLRQDIAAMESEIAACTPEDEPRLN